MLKYHGPKLIFVYRIYYVTCSMFELQFLLIAILITLANSFYQDHARQNVGPDLDQSSLKPANGIPE